MVECCCLQLVPYSTRAEVAIEQAGWPRTLPEQRTPAMAAGLTEFIWSIAEVLCTPVYLARGPG
jgi:hypothetical protein